MSPPIRDGSGSSIGAVRLGDGTEISEVRTGAGDVVFSGSAIPDSEVWQTLSESEIFWLENNTEFFYSANNPGSGNTLGRGFTDEFMSRVSSGGFSSAGSPSSITETITDPNGGYEFQFQSDSSRYLLDVNQLSTGSFETYTSVGPWNLTNRSTFHYYHQHDDGGSNLSGAAIFLVDPQDPTVHELVNVIGSNSDGVTTSSGTFDISGINSDREIYLAMNDSTNDNTAMMAADLFFA